MAKKGRKFGSLSSSVPPSETAGWTIDNEWKKGDTQKLLLCLSIIVIVLLYSTGLYNIILICLFFFLSMQITLHTKKTFLQTLILILCSYVILIIIVMCKKYIILS